MGTSAVMNDQDLCFPHATIPTRVDDVRGFSDGLFPLHSPLLRESLLVSFPPLSDMLKFSGLSRPS